MVFKKLISRYQTQETSLHIDPDRDGLGITFDHAEWEQLSVGKGSQLAQHQFVLLKMLLEQGVGERIRCGIYIPSQDVTALDPDTRETLLLPAPWPWSLRLETKGKTLSPGFKAWLTLINGFQNRIPRYDMKGPLIILSDTEQYLPTFTQWQALDATTRFNAIPVGERDVVVNLELIYVLKDVQSQDSCIEVEGFGDLDVVKPDKVGVAIDEDKDGNLRLTPTLGPGMDPADIGKRLGQVTKGQQHGGSIRVRKRIVILDERRMAAVQEIITNSHIPAKNRKAFFKNPTAWLDASLVDLDLGFSFRVQGAGPFRHAYFGETDETGIDWFKGETDSGGPAKTRAPKLIPPEELRDIIKNPDDLEQLRDRLNDAIESGAEQISFGGHDIPLNNPQQLKDTLADIERDLEKTTAGPPADPTVIVISPDDENAPELGVPPPPLNYRGKHPVDYSQYARKPFPHQQEAISWLLGLAQDNWCPGLGALPHRGALLADDMGLGKTFVSLVFAREYLRSLDPSKSHGPVLVVAPLVLLENWRREIEGSYCSPYFERVVMLQAEADLRKYRIENAGSELTMNRGVGSDGHPAKHEPEMNAGIEAPREEMLDRIRYALEIGSRFGNSRLDLPGSIILTTYETLRDYQFSLALIDWSIVVFDEAQNIKNPNAIKTHAAKALKAKFKLVMTGTPVENSLADFWCLFDTLLPGALGAYQDFRKRYIRPITSAAQEDVPRVRMEVGEELRNAASGFMLRRVKEEHIDGLPEKRLILGKKESNGSWSFDPRIARNMDDIQLERYQAVVNETIERMSEEEGGRGQALAGLHRLRQVSLHPDLLEGAHPGIPTSEREARDIFSRSGKLVILLDILEEIRARAEKVIIFLINKKLQETLQPGLRLILGCEANVINGDTSTISKRRPNTTRQGIIDQFESADGFEVLIMSPIAAGVGLTITSANNVIHLERHWNPAKEAQATDRVYRIGQEKDVNVYYPTLLHPEADSFDTNLNRLLASKQGLKDAVMVPDEVSENAMIASGIFGQEFSNKETPVSIDDVTRLGWEMFEALVAELYARQGSDVLLTQKGRDKGADVVLLEKDNGCTLIQAKHTKRAQINGYVAIQEVHGSVPYYQEKLGHKVTGKQVFTNAERFSDEAIKHARIYGVELVTRKELSKLLKKTSITHGELMHRNRKRTSI